MSFRPSWKMYLPGAITVVVWYGAVKFITANQETVKRGHDFVPIYGEDGKLQGFTHPVLVEAGNKVRADDAAKEQAEMMAAAGGAAAAQQMKKVAAPPAVVAPAAPVVVDAPAVEEKKKKRFWII